MRGRAPQGAATLGKYRDLLNLMLLTRGRKQSADTAKFRASRVAAGHIPF